MNMEILAESAVRITVLALGVAVVLRVLRIRSPRLRHGVWTAVVVIMLLMPAFVALGPRLVVPLLPSHDAGEIGAPAPGGIVPAEIHTSPPAVTPVATRAQRITLIDAAVVLYFAAAGFLLLRLVMGLRRARAIRRSAVLVQGRLTHPACVTPITIGLVSPAVILPADWTSWDGAELAAVLAHEEEHACRWDPLVAAIALLNRAVFWFHPLAWWLPRELSGLSEQVCDDAVISHGHDSDLYVTCLVRFARRVSAAGNRIAPTAIAMPGAGLQERLGMLARPDTARSSRLHLVCAAVLCASLVMVCSMATPTAASQGVPPASSQPPWAVHTSDHFEIFHDGLSTDRVNDAASDAEAAYTRLSAALKHEMPRPVIIVLVRRDRDLAFQARVVPPGADPIEQRLVISLESLDRRTDVIVHELTHQFAFEIVPDTSRAEPLLIEGLAEHQRGIWDEADLRRIWDAAEAGVIPPVATGAITDRYWAHAIFDFVAARQGEEGVRRLLFALRTRGTLAQSVTMAFGVTLDQFDEGFRGYVLSRFGRA